jgi:uncharacterized delta-60 repeat protein
MAIIIDWNAIPNNKIITRSELYNAIVSGFFSGSFTNPSKQAITKSVLTSSNISYDPSNSYFSAKSSNQLIAKRDLTNLKSYFDNVTISVRIDSSGNIFVAGSQSSYNGSTSYKITKILPNGLIDSSFNAPSFNFRVDNFIITPDSKIIAIGPFTNVSGVSVNNIVRLNSNGTIDTSFNSGGTGFSGGYSSATMEIYGSSIFIAGGIGSYNGGASKPIIKINLNGSVDTSFSCPTFYQAINSPNIFRIIQQPDGKIIAMGQFDSCNSFQSFAIVRLNSNGSVDTTFTSPFSSGSLVYDSILVGSQILITGIIYQSSGYLSAEVVRLNSNGTVDNSFSRTLISTQGSSGRVSDFNSSSSKIIATMSNGSIVVVGTSGSTGYTNIAKLNANGGWDSSFQYGTGFNNDANSCVIQSDDKIIVVGSFTSFSGSPRTRIARLNSDGTLDTTF